MKSITLKEFAVSYDNSVFNGPYVNILFDGENGRVNISSSSADDLRHLSASMSEAADYLESSDV